MSLNIDENHNFTGFMPNFHGICVGEDEFAMLDLIILIFEVVLEVKF
jgi:hypothetical protein